MSDTAATVRPATPADIEAITAIYNATVHTTTAAWTEVEDTLEYRQDWFNRQQAVGNPVLVAEVEGQVVGFTSYGDFRDAKKWPGYRFSVEHTIHVAEAHWGKGIGRSLLEELIAQAGRAGKHVMIAAVDGDNLDSLRFHEALGFREVARMPETGFKFGHWLDLVFLQRTISPS